jgi:hypothetical protein
MIEELTRFKSYKSFNPFNPVQTFFALTRFSQALTPSEGVLTPYLLLRARSEQALPHFLLASTRSEGALTPNYLFSAP